MTLIGSSIGSIFGHVIQLGARAQRTLLLAGAAGGLGAIFRTPLGGAVTAVEVLYKEDFESDALIPCIISSVAAYTVFSSFIGYGHMLNYNRNIPHQPMELLFYVVLGLVSTFAAYSFVKFYHFTGIFIREKIRIPRLFLPAIGGLLLGCIAYFVPHVLGAGLNIMQTALDHADSLNWILACKFFLVLALLKIIATTVTIQSGGSAGILIPSFFIGAMFGGLVGTISHHFYPASVPSISPFILVGMASFFSAATNASLGSLIMVIEITGGYELLPPLMITTAISLIVSHRWSIFKNQVQNKFFSKAHLWDMSPHILGQHKIEDIYTEFRQDAVIQENTNLKHMNSLIREKHLSNLLVCNSSKELMGIVYVHDLHLDDDDLGPAQELILAHDILQTNVPKVTRKDDFLKVIEYLSDHSLDIVAVVENSDNGILLLGYLTRVDVLKFYDKIVHNKRT